jgi:hypothetical protein
MARLKIEGVERTEERVLGSGRVVRMLFCRGEADGREGEFAVQLWSRDGGESFGGEDRVGPGAVVEGREPRNERFRTERGVPVYDWVDGERAGRERRGKTWELSGLAAVARDWLAEWCADRRAVRAMSRERMAFERRAKLVELTILALAHSHKDSAEFSKTMAFLEAKLYGEVPR